MKNAIFLFVTFVLVSFGAMASTNNANNTSYSYNEYEDSFTFVERGVTFAIFQNGEFDFYINPRNGLHVGYQGNGVDISFNSGYNYDAYVQYDNFGAIVQIENIYIDYDYYGRVNRIGNTNIYYHKGRLARLGGLRVYYDNHGYYSYCSGYINTYNRHYVYHPYHNYFVRPLFDFRIVSYKPYRHHYKPTRYTYYNDHSRNKYYGKNYRNYNQRNGQYTIHNRVATSNVPKRSNDRNYARSTETNRRIENRTNSTTQQRNSTNRSIEYGRSNSNRNSSAERGNTTNRRIENTRNDSNRNSTSNRETINRFNENRNSKERATSITKRSPEKSVRTTSSKVERNPIKRENNRNETTQTRSYKSSPSKALKDSERSNNSRKSSASRESKKSSDKERTTSNSSRRRG